MATEKIANQGAESDIVSSDVAGALKKMRCRYCQMEWEPGRPASHRPGCPNTDKLK